MKALCLNCSDSVALVAVINQDNIHKKFVTSPHCEKLMSTIDELLLESDANGLNVNNLDTLAVVVGPGSFTGIRIAVATIKGMSVVNKDTKLISITNFDLVKFGIKDKDCAVVLDSGNEEKYVGIYKDEILTKISALTEDEINLLNMPIYAPLSQKEQLNLNANFVEIDSDALILLTQQKYLKKEFVNINDLAPVYVKKSQAERTRSEKIITNLEIVPAKSAKELVEIENECFKINPWSEQLFEEEFFLNHKFYYIAKFEGKNIAYIGFETNLYDMNLQKIAVLEDYRNCGVATKLFNFSLEKKKILDKDKYFLEVNVNNTPAITLYKKLGFVIISTRKNYYKNGDACYVMQLQEE